jgi:ABC-type Fe3+ transport system substrate-binding protein
MDVGKISIAISIIALILSVATIGYTTVAVLPLATKVETLSTSVTQLSQQIGAAKPPELFAGEWALYEKAKSEGKLVVYTVWDVVDITTLLRGFQKRYPGIEVEYWSAKNPELITRVIEEFRRGAKSVDVIASDSAPPMLFAQGTIEPYETVQKDKLLVHDPRMPIVSIQIQILAYNTKLLKPEEAPKSWEDVVNTKAKVALDDPLRGGPLTWQLIALRDYWKDDNKWVAYIKALKQLKAPIYRSTSQMYSLLAAGEYALAIPILSQDLLRGKEQGAPVEWVKTAPPILVPRFAAIYKLAPHPNTAKLFAEWLISTEGQEAFASLMRTPSVRNFPSPIALENMFPEGTPLILVKFPDNPSEYIEKEIKPIWESA